MGGFADGDAVQVDVGSADSASKSWRRNNRPVTSSPANPSLNASSIRNILCDLDIYIADPMLVPQYDPASLQYMLDFFRNVAQSIPTDAAGSASASLDGDTVMPLDPGVGRDDSSKRAGIIVLREDLDFYAIPPKADIDQPEMIDVKRAAAKALLKQDGIFSGLKRSDEPGTTEAHLIEMLTAG